MDPTPCDQCRLIVDMTSIKTTAQYRIRWFAFLASIESVYSRRNDRFVIFVKLPLSAQSLRLFPRVYDYTYASIILIREYIHGLCADSFAGISIQRSRNRHNSAWVLRLWTASIITRLLRIIRKYVNTAVSSRNLFACKKNNWKIGLVDREKDCLCITISST